MPKDIQCKNDCGILRKVKKSSPDVVGHALVAVVRKDGKRDMINLSTVYAVTLYICDSCGLIELYDIPSSELLGEYVDG